MSLDSKLKTELKFTNMQHRYEISDLYAVFWIMYICNDKAIITIIISAYSLEFALNFKIYKWIKNIKMEVPDFFLQHTWMIPWTLQLVEEKCAFICGRVFLPVEW